MSSGTLSIYSINQSVNQVCQDQLFTIQPLQLQHYDECSGSSHHELVVMRVAIYSDQVKPVAVLRQVLAGPMPCHRKNRTWRWDLPVILYRILMGSSPF